MNANAFELIRDLEDELRLMKDRLHEIKQLFWENQNRLEVSEERVWLLEQLADPNNDGRPYSDTLRT